jgi:hypothetical protein
MMKRAQVSPIFFLGLGLESWKLRKSVSKVSEESIRAYNNAAILASYVSGG